MVSDADLDGALALCPDARLRYVPNVVDVAAITPVTASVGARRALFVANFAYAPNRYGMRFLLDEVFPRVWAELPDARLALVGGGLERPPSADARVETLGFVDDLARRLRRRVVRGRAAAAGRRHAAEADRSARLRTAGDRHAARRRRARRPRRRSTRSSRPARPSSPPRSCACCATARHELGSSGRALAAERYSIEALSVLLAP